MGALERLYEWRAWVKSIPRLMREREISELRAAEYMRDAASAVFVSAKGAEYPAWMGDDSRTSATPGDLNAKLLYQMESLFRDVLFKETHLTTEAGTNTTTIVCLDLAGETDTYYDGAYVQNFTTGTLVKVTSYVASTKTLTVPTSSGQTTGDLFSVFNINGSNQINHASFDAVATVGYDRAGWLGDFSIYQPTDSFSLLTTIAMESGVLWFRNNQNKETVKTLDDRAADFTLTTAHVSEVEGMPQIRVFKTSTDMIYNEFTVNYRYDYVRGAYTATETLDHKDTSLDSDTRTGFRDGYETYTGLCAGSRSKYKINRPLVVDLPHIRDRDTAQLKLKQLANFSALQRYVVDMDLLMDATTCAIEEGDYGKINHALLPEALRNTAYFVVVDWAEIPSSQTYHVTMQETPWGT